MRKRLDLPMENKIKELCYAIVQSVPVMLGYLFLGFAFGLMLNDAGYGFWWAFFTSLFVYAGSMQFVLVTLLTAGASLWYTLIMTLFVNGRHMFYGLSFVEKFKKVGATYPYMIFSLTDETFSLLCDLKVREGMREERVSFYISLLDHCYFIHKGNSLRIVWREERSSGDRDLPGESAPAGDHGNSRCLLCEGH